MRPNQAVFGSSGTSGANHAERREGEREQDFLEENLKFPEK